MLERTALDIRVLGSLTELRALGSAWDHLWHSDPTATIFQSFEWVVTWLEHYEHCVARPLVITCVSKDQLVGLAPLYVREPSAWLPASGTVFLIGTGEREKEEAYAEYMAPICLPAWEEACVEAMANVVSMQRDIVGLEFQRVRWMRAYALASLVAAKWSGAIRESTAGRCFSMPTDLATALARISPKQRSALRRKYRRLLAEEGFKLEFADTERRRREFYRELIELHQKRWQRKGRAGVFGSGVFRSFHAALSSRLLISGHLLLARMSIGERPLALVYGFIGNGTCHYYQGGIDTEFLPEISPGLLMHLLVADELGKKAIHSYDLMLSSKADYKARIAQETEELHNFVVKKAWPARLRTMFRGALASQSVSEVQRDA